MPHAITGGMAFNTKGIPQVHFFSAFLNKPTIATIDPQAFAIMPAWIEQGVTRQELLFESGFPKMLSNKTIIAVPYAQTDNPKMHNDMIVNLNPFMD